MEQQKNFLDCLLKLFLSFVLVLTTCFVAPTLAQADNVEAQKDTSVDEQSSAEQSDYSNQYFADLLENESLAFSKDVNTETLTSENETLGVLVSLKGDSEDSSADESLDGLTLSVSKEFNFDDENQVSRIRFQAMTARKTQATVECYLDDETVPLASFELNDQKKSNNWDLGTKDYCLDISKKNITGKHHISFKVTKVSSENSLKDQKIIFKSFEFMKFSVPVLNFDINETKGHTIESMNTSTNHSVECYGSLNINVPENWTSEYTGEHVDSASYKLDYVRGRGNSTWLADTTHRPYKVKLDNKAGLLGMGKNKHWVLIANYYDNSQLRNKITYWLSEQLGFKYTVKLEPVEVVMGDEYYGSYFLCEQVRVGKNRLDIDDLEDEKESTDEITNSGGYLLNLGSSEDKHKGFNTTTSGDLISWTIESPDFDGYFNEQQYSYIRNYIENVESALYSDDFCDDDGKRYSDYLDLKSAVDYLWLQEFSMNGDGYLGGSTYLFKEREGMLYFGPAWDFDYVAWGATEYDEDSIVTNEWSVTGRMWVNRLLKDPEFAEQFISRWSDLKKLMNEITRLGGKLDEFAARMSTAVNYNVEKYGMTSFAYDEGTEDSEEPVVISDEKGSLSFDQEIDRLRAWIEQREAWVNNHVNQLAPSACTISYKSGNTVIKKVNAYVGDYFMLDCEEPTKAGSKFLGWQLSYKINYDQYLRANGLTEEELIEKEGSAFVEKLKKEGYSFTTIVNEDESMLVPCDITLTALFSANNNDNKTVVKPLLGSIVSKKGVRYQVTCTNAKNGRSVKVVGLSNKKAKKITIPKWIKIKGKKYTVTEIGTKAFAGCKKLKQLRIKSKGLFVRNSTFKSLKKKAVIKVPKSGLRHYKSVIKCRKVRKL